MKTQSFFGKKRLHLERRCLDLPEVGEQMVLVRVLACGICGTDLNFIRDWEGDFQPLGHEISAEVVEVGAGITTIRPGDLVTVEDCSMCGTCEDCKKGHSELCRRMYTLNGFPGMGEYLVVKAANLNVFHGLDPVSASLTEPLAVALSAVLAAQMPPCGSVMVLGSGPIGLLCARVAKISGAGFVGISGRSADTPMARARLALAEKLGCDLVVKTAVEDIRETVLKHYPSGVDRVIVTSPPKSLDDAFRIIRYGGTIVFLGLSFAGENCINFDVNAAIFNKTTLKPCFAEPAIHFPTATELIRKGMIDASLFQTHTFRPDQAQEVLTATLEGSLPVIKPVFIP